MPDCSASTMPVNMPGQQHDGQRADADRVELLDDVAEVERPA